jgi:hypothetical protein
LTVQCTLNAGVASGALKRGNAERCHVWRRAPPVARHVRLPGAMLQGYDTENQRCIQACMAARPPAPPGQVIRYGVGWQ